MSAPVTEKPAVDVDLASLPSLDAEVECCAPLCGLEATWAVTMPCGCSGPLCQPHKDREHAVHQRLVSATMTMACKICGADPLDPNAVTWRRL